MSDPQPDPRSPGLRGPHPEEKLFSLNRRNDPTPEAPGFGQWSAVDVAFLTGTSVESLLKAWTSVWGRLSADLPTPAARRRMFFRDDDGTPVPMPAPSVQPSGFLPGQTAFTLRQAAEHFGRPAGDLYALWLTAWGESLPSPGRSDRNASERSADGSWRVGPYLVATTTVVKVFRVARIPRPSAPQPRFVLRDGKACPSWPPHAEPGDRRLTVRKAAVATGERPEHLWAAWEATFDLITFGEDR